MMKQTRILESAAVFLAISGLIALGVLISPDLFFVPLAVGLVAVCGVSLLLKRKG